MKYECPPDCAACCKGHLIVEVEDLDILREPRLIEGDPHWKGTTVDQMLDEYGNGMAVIIALGKPCSFLCGNKCTIYPTRPNCCVAFLPGEDECSAARAAEGLPPLLPIAE